MTAAPAPSSVPADDRLRALFLAALGVVYADIGTSPLYTIRECFRGPAAVPVSEAHVLGVLSLIIWSLLFLVSFMYLQLILRVDNEGAALLYGNGLLTPAISVLSAVEGLQVATPVFPPRVVPITIAPPLTSSPWSSRPPSSSWAARP